MDAQTRTEHLFTAAKKLGMVNPYTGDGLPSLSMVAEAISDAEGDAYSQKCGDEMQRTIAVQRVLSDLNQRVHSGYDFNADPDGMTLRVGEALKN